MVLDFLHQRGLERLRRLLLQHRNDLNGVLFGQLMNLAMYSSTPLFIQAPLVALSDRSHRQLSAFFQEINAYLEIAVENQVYPPENAADVLSSPTEHLLMRDASFQSHTPERMSSLSEDSRMSDLSFTPRVGGDLEERKSVSLYIIQHLCLWLGFAAGAIRYMLKNGGRERRRRVMGRSDSAVVCGFQGGEGTGRSQNQV